MLPDIDDSEDEDEDEDEVDWEALARAAELYETIGGSYIFSFLFSLLCPITADQLMYCNLDMKKENFFIKI